MAAAKHLSKPIRRPLAGLAALLTAVCLCGAARAEPSADKPDSGQSTPKSAAPRPARARASTRGAHTLVTFIGYRRVSADSDQVYVELTESANIETTRHGRTIELRIEGAKITRRNNKNPLVASQFDSIVDSARLVQAGKNVHLVIRLRAAAEPQSRVVPRSGGATLEVNLTRTSGALPPDDAPKPGKKKHKKKS